MYKKWAKKTHQEIGGVLEDGASDENFGRPRPNFKVNTKVEDEILSAHQIRKKKLAKDDMKLKNMKKDQRRQIETKNRKNKKEGEVKHINNRRSKSWAIVK